MGHLLKPVDESVLSPHLPLAAIEASQRAIAKVVGVDKKTVSRDLKHSSGANAPPTQKNPNKTKAPDPPRGANAPPTQDSGKDADPNEAPSPDSGRAAVTLPQDQADWQRFISNQGC